MNMKLPVDDVTFVNKKVAQYWNTNQNELKAYFYNKLMGVKGEYEAALDNPYDREVFEKHYSNGDVHKNNSADSGSFASFGINDILGMYVDLDNGKVYFSKNGEMQNSGDPTSGSTGTGAISITTGQTYIFGATGYGGGASQMNFGSPPYAVSSGNSDPNGYGNFEYGTQNYYSLNSKNLAEFG